MSEQLSVPPPLPATLKTKWRWLRIAIGVILGMGLFAKIITSYDPVNLDVAVQYNRVTIGNVGSKPIKIMSVTVNDRTDCTVLMAPSLFTDPNKLGFSPKDLKVGDEIELMSSCKVIRATVETDQGSESYSFGSN